MIWFSMAMKQSFSFLLLFANIIKLCKVDSVADTEMIILLLSWIELVLNFIVHRGQWLDIQDKPNPMEILYQNNYIIHVASEIISIIYNWSHLWIRLRRFLIVLAEINCRLNAYFHSVHSLFFNNYQA